MRALLKIFFLGIICFSQVLAFEIDETMTTRVLKTSDSKRTILINRGLEDGVTVDDHAKFYLTSGVQARGVAVKVAPTRSVWSLYRLVNPDGIYIGRVMDLKKTRPIDLTEDRSRQLSLSERGGAIAVPSTIRLAPGADDLPEGFDITEMSQADREDYFDFTSDRISLDRVRGTHGKSWEFWGLLSINSMSASSDLSEGETNQGSFSNLDITAGLEKYKLFGDEFLPQMSFLLYAHRSNQDVMTVLGSQISLDAFGVGFGVNYHFLFDPQAYGRFLPYASFSGGFGRSSDQVIFQSGTSTVEEEPLDGTFTFFSAGFGMKYFLSSGFGVRAMLDFYQRAESYLLDNDDEFTKTLAGPRIQAGISWRW